MEKGKKFECATCYFQGKAKEFTPITVGADFAALNCPPCRNNDAVTFEDEECA